MSEVTIANYQYIKEGQQDDKITYKSTQKINGYNITITCLNLPNGDEKAFNSIKKFFEKEIF
ncbi:hypothetical protein LQ50_07810 [Halalkalibacter okhensis]|uniref:Uncharacterized protein n=1 Tax=Halalkalibacter okhensis TaxID=333138 RepID=A0A0B0ILZ1_9BACI|nr:hypothetical protein LQ50_07810 [Halalkalibacter okhensis]